MYINILDSRTDLNKVNFIYFKLEIPDTDIKIVIWKKFIKPQTTLRQAMKYILLGDGFRRVEDDIVYLDSSVSFFEYNKKFYILDRNFFNSLFKFRNGYEKLIENNIEEIKKCDFIDGLDSFIDKCKSNGHYVKKISKAITSNCFENVKNNRNKIPNIINDYGLKIKLDKDNKIIYNDENIQEILDLLLEHYVRSALTDEKVIAKAIDYKKKIS